MDLHEIQYLVYSGIITQCKIVNKNQWYYISLFYVEEEKWQLLKRKRRGVRIFMSVQSAIYIAEEMGFNTVTLVEPDPIPERD